jgi:WD40 repeat protein
MREIKKIPIKNIIKPMVFCNENLLLIQSDLKRIDLFEIDKQTVFKSLFFIENVNSFYFSKNNQLVVINNPKSEFVEAPSFLRIINIETLEIIKEYPISYFLKVIPIENLSLIVLSNFNGEIAIFDLKLGKMINNYNIDPFSELIVDESFERLISTEHDGCLTIWDTKTGKEISFFLAFEELPDLNDDPVYEFKAFFIKNEIFLTSQSSNIVSIYDPENRKKIETNMKHQDKIFLSKISNDKTRLITVSYEKTYFPKIELSRTYNDFYLIKIWNLNDKKLIDSIEFKMPLEYSDYVYNFFDIKDISFSPNNTKLSILSEKMGLLIYNLNENNCA